MFSYRATSSLARQLSSHLATRMASTLVGASGRVYTQLEVLRLDHRTKEPRIFKAQCGSDLFVYKRVSESFFGLSQELATTFHDTDCLRMHTDYNEDQHVLVYPYFRDTLLGLIQSDPTFPPSERPKILRATAEAINQMHSQGWVHLDVKPDNILVDWDSGEDGHKTVSKTVLGDFDIAFHPPPGKRLDTPYPLGNVMWRSPEGQTGRGVTSASDVFSFGLVCIYTLGGGDFLLLDSLEELAKNNILPAQEIMTRHFSYFGPVTEGLLEQVDDEVWCKALRGLSDAVDEAVLENPALRFTEWGQSLGPAAVDLLSGMTKPDPTARLTMEQVLAHPWWLEE
ncbi:serine threonine protein kinase [Ophiostoma piceae UAMH 11346]|uniref:Serine threonine protein kinase n=1 Tax=Ophiostoma piceae (strain UAMH 11346) TaxID=1262450 RepID=S3BZ67_OPHP1|nr:serine threonine protein kinase [Ophiostoma piceae UAMH 11346]